MTYNQSSTVNPYWNPYYQFLAKVSKSGAWEASENWFSVVRFGTLPLGLLVRHRRHGERQIRRWRQRRGQCRGSPVAQQCPPCVEKFENSDWVALCSPQNQRCEWMFIPPVLVFQISNTLW